MSPSTLLALAGFTALTTATTSSSGSQLRLAYAGPHGMHVSWNTPHRLPHPLVHYGTSPNHLTKSATSHVSVTYQTSDTFNNHVLIPNLKAGTTYYYCPETCDCSKKPYSFTTSRAAGDGQSFDVAVVVDLGTMGELGLTTHVGDGAANPLKKGERNTIQALEATKGGWEFLWHPGDIAYADYWLKEEIQNFLPNTTIEDGYKVYNRILNAFYDEMTPVTSVRPYMVGPGNHEANCDNGGYTNDATGTTYNVSICMPGQTNFTSYRHHFRMPSAQSGGLGNFWYSFDYGMAHFVQLDTETDLGHGLIGPDEPNGSEGDDAGPFGKYMNQQIDWLKKDLAAVDRTKTPWVIAAGHRPWYVNADPGDMCTDCQDAFEPLLYQYNVDLVMSGHVHLYQRNAPVYRNKSDPAELENPRFPWYITNGAAGHYDGLDSLVYPLQKYSRAAVDTVYGWSRLKFHNATHLTHEFVASGNGSVLDSATLYKKR